METEGTITIYKIMEDHIKFEKKLELIKEDLSSQLEASFPTFQKFLDPQKKGELSVIDLLNMLTKLKVKLTDRVHDTTLIFHQLDRNMNNKLDEKDIKDMFLPRMPQFADPFKKKTNVDKIAKNTLAILSRLFDTYRETEIKNDEDKKRLGSRKARDAFEECDRFKQNFITGTELDMYLKNYRVPATKEDVFLLLCRYDKDNDGKITLSEVFFLY